ncbi:MAG TPA: NAD(P)H-hydrate epimerase, partial [Candidatus Thermoplasmatota archaeon]|nr:NAD(P)H-hydrate epimerase [Candidatus Thermoplasmatota archaeon]
MAGRAGKREATGGSRDQRGGADGHDAAEARRLDLNAAELGAPVERLMANAGKALAKELSRHAKRGEDVLLLCGKGNNGGDGFAAAAELQAMGRNAWVVLAEPPSRVQGRAARAHLARVAKPKVAAWSGRPRPAWSRIRVLADCLLGSGLSGEPRAPYAAMVRWLDARRKAGATVVSCDVPSGLGTAVAVRPTVTIALHRAHGALSKPNAGRIAVRPIGMPTRAADIGFGDLEAAYPDVRRDSHKGDNGTVLVVGGSGPLAGAPHYVALGAYRSGADLVHVAAPTTIAATIRAWGPEAIVHAVGRG